MNWFNQLKEDAQPKADAVRNVVSNLLNTKAVTMTKGLGHNTLVSTVGVTLNLAEPVVGKVKNGWSSMWRGIEKLAETPVPAKR